MQDKVKSFLARYPEIANEIPDIVKENAFISENGFTHHFMMGYGFHFYIKVFYFPSEMWENGYKNYGILIADLRESGKPKLEIAGQLFICDTDARDNLEGARRLKDDFKNTFAMLYFESNFNRLWATWEKAQHSLKTFSPTYFRLWYGD